MTVSNAGGSNVCNANLVVNGCGDGTKNCNEACDPNDPTKAGRGKDGCSVDCQPINNPEFVDCSLSLTPNPICLGSGATLSWSIYGTYTNSPSIIAVPALSGFPYAVSSANGTTTVTPPAIGTYAFSMTVNNTAGAGTTKTCTANLTVQDCTVPLP
jgi:hypothetical protein